MRPRQVAGRVLRRARRAAASLRLGLDHVVVPPQSERALRRRLRAEGASFAPRRPSPLWNGWVNRALLGREEVEAAHDEVVACGLPPHGDRPKNWDLLVALGTILESCPPGARILDAGAPHYARLLPWLYLYGYRELHGIDLVYERAARLGPIRYERMDLTRTTFPDESFEAIACLSVIEHGVDVPAYVDEAARLLRPGGLLVTSTDFWCEPVETHGQEAYGVPIRILGPADIEALVAHAASRGLRPVRPLHLACRERAVRWERFGLDYTFVNVVLRKAG